MDDMRGDSAGYQYNQDDDQLPEDDAPDAPYFNDIRAQGLLPPKRNPQEHGWTAPTKLDYNSILAPASSEGRFASTKSKYEPELMRDEAGNYSNDLSLETFLFDSDIRPQAGTWTGVYDKYKVTVVAKENPDDIGQMGNFQDERLHPSVRANLAKMKYKVPTPIQSYAMPYMCANYDVLAAAMTGSGKTTAYLAPILSKLLENDGKLLKPKPNPMTFDQRNDKYVSEPVVIIVVPTRELAVQVGNEVARLSYRTPVRYALAYGGAPRMQQVSDIHRGCDLLIGTPGRLKDIVEHFNDRLSLQRVRYVVLDEADELINADWRGEMDAILKHVDDNASFSMYSATFRPEARELAREYLSERRMMMYIGRFGATTDNIHQVVFYVNERSKPKALFDLLCSLPAGRTIVFCNSRRVVDEVDAMLYQSSFPCSAIHGGRHQREREEAIDAFKKSKIPILVTTGLSARGMDFPEVKHVINYQLPSTEYGGIDEYIHRIGRTARIGNRGQATAFYSDQNLDLAEDLAKLLTENRHSIPDFLKPFAPQDGTQLFEEPDLDQENKFEIAPRNTTIGDSNIGGDTWADGKPAATGQPEAQSAWGGSGASAEATGMDEGW